MTLLPVIVTWLVYLPSLRYGFLLDDHVLFETSASLTEPGSIARGFVTDVGALRKGAPTVISSYYRPVFLALSTIYHRVAGPDAHAWHFAAVALASAVAGIAGLVLARFGLSPGHAALAAAVFALHPSHVSSVAWVAGLQDLLATCFVLLAVLAATKRGGDRGAAVLAALAFAAGLLSKEVALGLLPFVAVWSSWEGDGPRRARLRAVTLTMAVVAAIYLAVRVAVLGGLAQPPEAAPTFARGLASIPLAVFTYLKLALLPVGWSIFRPERPVAAALAWPNVLAWVALLAAAALGVAWLRRRRDCIPACMWFVCFLAPSLNLWALLPEWMVTDRYLFLPSLALPWLIALLLPRGAATWTLVGASVVYAGLSLRYQPIFHDETTFIEAMEQAEPTSALVWTEKARLLRARNRFQEAEQALERSLELRPGDAFTLVNLGDVEVILGRLDEAELHYRASLASEPGGSRGFKRLVIARSQAGQADAAMAISAEAVTRWPDDFETQLLAALMLRESGDLAGAEHAFAEARRIRPLDPSVQGGLEAAYARLAPTVRPPTATIPK